MKIFIRQIHKGGFDVPFTPPPEWLTTILNHIFNQNDKVDLASIKGQVHLENLSENIHLNGSIEFDHHPLCARCGVELHKHLKIPLQATLVPKHAMTGDTPLTEAEETELTADDLDFAFYEGEEIDIAPLINDEISLAQPYNDYCENTAICEKNRDENFKRSGLKTGDPRWDALKEFKTRQ